MNAKRFLGTAGIFAGIFVAISALCAGVMWAANEMVTVYVRTPFDVKAVPLGVAFVAWGAVALAVGITCLMAGLVLYCLWSFSFEIWDAIQSGKTFWGAVKWAARPGEDVNA